MYPKPAPIKRAEIGRIIQRRKGLSIPFGFFLTMFVILTVLISDLERKETTEEAQLPPTLHVPPLAQAIEQECLCRWLFSNDITFHKAYPCFCSTSRHRTNRSHHSFLLCCPLKLYQRNCPFYLQRRTQKSISALRERHRIWYFIPETTRIWLQYKVKHFQDLMISHTAQHRSQGFVTEQ